jgi:hypothetical protein
LEFELDVWWPNRPSTMGSPKILSLSLAATSFYGAEPPSTPKIWFYPTVATIFIVPRGGDTQILIIISPLPTQFVVPYTLPSNLLYPQVLMPHSPPIGHLWISFTPSSELIITNTPINNSTCWTRTQYN